MLTNSSKSKTLTLPDIGEIKIEKNCRNKNIRLKIKPPGIVWVSMPANADFNHAEKLIKEQQEWIKEKLEIARKQEIKKEIIDENTNFRTEKHTLKFHTYSRERFETKIRDNIINIYYYENWDITDDFVQKCIRKSIGMALKIEGREYLTQRLEYWSKKTGLKYNGFTLVDVKSHWGMCMKDNRIKLNVHLIRLPKELIDYIILHELAHIKEKNHSSKFYDFLGTLLPNHRELSKEMKKYSPDKFLTTEKGVLPMKYSENIMKLTELGEPDTENWLNYKDLGITEQDIPELIELLKDKEYGFDSEDDIKCWGQANAWRALGQLRAKEAVIPLTARFDDDKYTDWGHEEIPEVFAMIGKDAIEPLKNYLFDNSKPKMGRITIADGLKCIAQKNPELKDDCIKVLSDYLKQATEDYLDLNGFVVSYLADLKAVNSIDVIRQAYEKGIVSFGVTGDLEDVEVFMGFREKRTTPKPRYNELFHHNGIQYTAQEPVVKDKKVGRNDPCPCGSGKKYKKCCLK